MSGLFENAIGSIRVGIQDYGSPEDHRHISAVRNYYAGILLLAKAVLIHRYPHEDPDNLIASNLKPVRQPNGTVNYIPASRTTIDFATIGRRFDDLGIVFDHKLLKGLNTIRNEVEHKFSSLTRTAIVEAIAKGFPVTAQLLKLMDEDPVKVLGDEWKEMLKSRNLFDLELEQCVDTLEDVEWISGTISYANLVCNHCESNLVMQADPENALQNEAELRCRSCGAELEVEDVIEKTIDDVLGIEAYIRKKDAGEDGPIYDCPSCDRATFIDFENQCANCGEIPDSAGSCAICSETFSTDYMLHNPDATLCGYHQYQMDKDD